jgi:hypothetical protein
MDSGQGLPLIIAGLLPWFVHLLGCKVQMAREGWIAYLEIYKLH